MLVANISTMMLRMHMPQERCRSTRRVLMMTCMLWLYLKSGQVTLKKTMSIPNIDLSPAANGSKLNQQYFLMRYRFLQKCWNSARFHRNPLEWNWTPLELAWNPVEFKHSCRNGTAIQIFSAFTKSCFEIHLHRIYFFFLSYNLVTICIIVFISSVKQLIPYADNLLNSL